AILVEVKRKERRVWASYQNGGRWKVQAKCAKHARGCPHTIAKDRHPDELLVRCRTTEKSVHPTDESPKIKIPVKGQAHVVLGGNAATAGIAGAPVPEKTANILFVPTPCGRVLQRRPEIGKTKGHQRAVVLEGGLCHVKRRVGEKYSHLLVDCRHV